METRFTNMSDREKAMPSGDIRQLSEDEWIAHHSSGSLQKAKRLGFSYRNLYIEERTAHEFGWTFQCVPKSRIIFGDALMEGDNPSLTETCWFALRMFNRNPFPDSDKYEVKYLKIYDAAGEVESEGVGLIVKETSATWLPKGNLVFAILAKWSGKEWMKAENPF